MGKSGITLLIDGDILIYKAAMAVERSVDWGDGLWSRWGYMSEAEAALQDMLFGWIKRLSAEHAVVCLSCPTHQYWRHAIAPESGYKAHRSAAQRPVLLTPLRAFVEERFDCKVKPNIEADDLLGIIATHNTIVPGPKIIVSEDKDLKGIPGKLYNPRTDELSTISVQQADGWHLYQTLVGDSADGYKGCPGVGPKKAVGVTRWDEVVAFFKKAGLTEDDALLQARLARICRASDYDFKKQEVILWTPNQ